MQAVAQRMRLRSGTRRTCLSCSGPWLSGAGAFAKEHGGAALVGGRDGLSHGATTYVTVVSNPKKGIVLYVAQGRRKTSAGTGVLRGDLGKARRAAVESVSMDHVSGPYIAATLEMIPEALKKIAFDRFHVAKHLGDAVDQGAARGAPGAREGGKRNPHGVEVPVAEGPRAKDAPGEAGVRQAARTDTRRTRPIGLSELKEAAATPSGRYKSRTWRSPDGTGGSTGRRAAALDPVVKAATHGPRCTSGASSTP